MRHGVTQLSHNQSNQLALCYFENIAASFHPINSRGFSSVFSWFCQITVFTEMSARF